MRAAAVGFVLVTAGVVWSRTTGSPPDGALSAASNVFATTKVAERSLVKLPDGSFDPVAEFVLELSLKRKG